MFGDEVEYGFIVKIVHPNHKYFGDDAVIVHETPKKYYVRLLYKTLPLMQQFIEFQNGKLNGTRSCDILFYIAKEFVKVSKRRTVAMPREYDDECDPGKLLQRYKGMTHEQIEQRIRK